MNRFIADEKISNALGELIGKVVAQTSLFWIQKTALNDESNKSEQQTIYSSAVNSMERFTRDCDMTNTIGKIKDIAKKAIADFDYPSMPNNSREHFETIIKKCSEFVE